MDQMEKLDWTQYQNKRVYLQLKNRRVYTGKVVDVSDDPVLISIRDKFDKLITISIREIAFIQEER